MNFRDLIRTLEAEGFELVRNPRGSHRIYEGFVDGKRRLVTIAAHNLGDDVRKGTLSSIVRQSGLSKKKFR